MHAIKTLIYNVEQAQKLVDDYEIDTDSQAVINAYEDMLDEGGDVAVCGYTYTPSRVFKLIDEIAYRHGLNDYVDRLDKEEQDDYKELVEALEEAQAELDAAESEVES